MEEDFPFIAGDFYEQSHVRKKLHTGGQQGICPCKFLDGDIVVFMNAHDAKKRNKNTSDAANIYHDSYNDSLGQYLYTGAGQKGDQTLTGRNLRLAEAKKNGKKIHFFRQYNPKSKHQYVGEVEVVGIKKGIQQDNSLIPIQRTVLVFHLSPTSSTPLHRITTYGESISREVESEISRSKKTDAEIEVELKKINKKILKEGPKIGNAPSVRNEAQTLRNKQIVTLLKQKHKKCMICRVPHFEKKDGSLFSTGAHIIDWKISHLDSIENIIILCPTCHSKFDHAKISDRKYMYKKLTENFPDTRFEKPLWMN
tara:strand:- start:546 stop:1478 length:933 start_codon:yes stop_codon:yes gene_type:complete